MKKITAIIAAAVAATALFALTACGGNSSDQPSDSKYSSAVELFSAAWDAVPEADKFPAMGGSVTAYVENAPGAFNKADNTEELMAMTQLTSDMLGCFGDDVATMIHMMNGNNFTGVVANTAGVSAQSFAADYVKVLQNTHWMCGHPDKAIVILAGNYVVFAFGENDDFGIIDTFKAAVLGLDSSFTVLAEANL